jgi:beta-glucosidase/6-phospho-beta-glucosidase/beta-galactosidase
MNGTAAEQPQRPNLAIIGGFESTFLPAHDRDIFETTGHDVRWKDDFALLKQDGVARLRYPVRWHRIEPVRGQYDWSETDDVLLHLRDGGFSPIVDLVHHTSYPLWLDGGFADPRFGEAYLDYAREFAVRYPWIEEYTLFNEPFSTLFLAGHEAVWPPYDSGLRGFVDLIANVLPALVEASKLYGQLLPGARHVWVDTCEHHTGSDDEGRARAAVANERRFVVLDAFLGRGYDTAGVWGKELTAAGGQRLLHIGGGTVDVLGLDYYAHCQWNYSAEAATTPTPTPIRFSELVAQYWDRYRIPIIITETNVRGSTPDRATWLKYVLEQCELAQEQGVPIEGFCWFPVIDSTDWDSLLFRCDGNIDPVGVYWLDQNLERRTSVMSRSYRLAANGAPASALPAYRLAEPVASWLKGYLPQMSHWSWDEPPATDRGFSLDSHTTKMELRIVDAQ